MCLVTLSIYLRNFTQHLSSFVLSPNLVTWPPMDIREIEICSFYSWKSCVEINLVIVTLREMEIYDSGRSRNLYQSCQENG